MDKYKIDKDMVLDFIRYSQKYHMTYTITFKQLYEDLYKIYVKTDKDGTCLHQIGLEVNLPLLDIEFCKELFYKNYKEMLTKYKENKSRYKIKKKTSEYENIFKYSRVSKKTRPSISSFLNRKLQEKRREIKELNYINEYLTEENKKLKKDLYDERHKIKI